MDKYFVEEFSDKVEKSSEIEQIKIKKQVDSYLDIVKNKKPLEIKADFARKNNTKVPTNRTVTRVLENLKDAGFVVKRKTNNKKAKAYYCLTPKLKIILEEKDPELRKKREIEQMRIRVKQIKEIIQDKK